MAHRKRKLASADAMDDGDWWLNNGPDEGNSNTIETTETEDSNAQKNTANDNKISDVSTGKTKSKAKKRKKKFKSDTTSDGNKDNQLLTALCNAAKLTPIEAEDYKLSESSFLEEPKSQSGHPDSLSTYLKHVIPQWKRDVKKYKGTGGSPILLVITSSASRAVDLNRASTEFKGKCCTIKLFAKHFKLHQHVELLKGKVHFAVATPNRVHKLVTEDALKLDKLKYVILDWNYRDAKERRLLDIVEIREDITQLLLKYFVPLAKEGKVKIGLF
ncbi:Protein CMSS1 [Trichoplax sp. H2]|nr:Protein CMSS1 [Trichoplax sp. H2]|eukprot:RDD37139.1 Protein CMSS1 [Trichoplax sp. H2]